MRKNTHNPALCHYFLVLLLMRGFHLIVVKEHTILLLAEVHCGCFPVNIPSP